MFEMHQQLNIKPDIPAIERHKFWDFISLLVIKPRQNSVASSLDV